MNSGHGGGMEKICIGVDVGGTSVKLGMFKLNGENFKKWEIPTDRTDNCKNVVGDIAKSIREQLEKEGYTLTDCVGIGMGVPGPVIPGGYVEVCVNLGWRDCYPSRELSDILEGIPVELGNDANVAALGESWQGGAKGFRDVVLLTLGTGVGGGVILDGRIVAGRHGIGGEIGHIHVREDETEYCNCKGRGCLEQVASATGIVQEAKRFLAASDKESKLRKFETLTCKDVFDCAKEGDELALEIVDVVAKYLGMALSHLSHIVDPDIIVLGGGVSKAGDFLLEVVQKKYDQFTTISSNKASVRLATLGNDAGIYGAARMCIE